MYLGIAIHGICYDYFFVTGQIYTDHHAGQECQSAAQGLITLGTYGIGLLIGSLIAGVVAQNFQLPSGLHNWQGIWLIPAVIAFVVMILFVVLFNAEDEEEIEAESVEMV